MGNGVDWCEMLPEGAGKVQAPGSRACACLFVEPEKRVGVGQSVASLWVDMGGTRVTGVPGALALRPKAAAAPACSKGGVGPWERRELAFFNKHKVGVGCRLRRGV